MPGQIPGVQRVQTLKILGVTIDGSLQATSHVDATVSACSRSLYALRVLRAHGLPPHSLHLVAGATTIAKLLYAAPSWCGLATEADRTRIERVLRRMKKTGYLPEEYGTSSEKVSAAEVSLLRAVGNCPNHVLRSIFPPVVERTYDRRPRPHDYQLPQRDDRNFINRVLFRLLRPEP